MAYRFPGEEQLEILNNNRGNAGIEIDPERSVLYGEDLRHTQPPFETVRNCGRKGVIFPNNDRQAFGFSEEQMSKHLLMLGGIGSGKTNVFNFIVNQLKDNLDANDVMLIFDTKGDFQERFYQSRNPRHLLIGNDKKYAGLTRSWNIFDELRNEEGQFDKRSILTAKEIAKQLFVGRESSTQPFFAQAAADLVSKAIIHLVRQAKKNGTENRLCTAGLVRFLRRANHETYYQMTEDPLNKDFISAQLYFGKPGEKLTAQALGVFGSINSMVEDLFVGVFAEDTGVGEISMRRLVQKKGARILFVEYDLATGEVLTPMYRILFDLALKQALGGREEERGNTYLIIDEFKLLPNLMHIDDALNFGRSLGVKVCAGLQSISQLYDIYGQDRGKVLAAGFMNCFCFQTMDPDSRQYISDRFGKTYENLAFRDYETPLNFQREAHSVEDWNIIDLIPGDAYVQMVGYKPFKYHFALFNNRL